MGRVGTAKKAILAIWLAVVCASCATSSGGGPRSAEKDAPACPDGDEVCLAIGLFESNGIELGQRSIERVINSVAGGTVVWVGGEFSGLPLFFHSNRYTFDEEGRVEIHPHTNEPRVGGQPPPSPASFPQDHRPAVAAALAVERWRSGIRADDLIGELADRWGEPETVLGFHNLNMGSSANPDIRLAWRVRPRGGRYPVAIVDARTGELLYFDSGVRT